MEEIGGYALVRRLGAGGMGTVWEALDGEGRPVAFKLIHPHIAADPTARERLSREVSVLRRASGPGVAQVLDAEIEASEAFIVTELIDGPTLEEDVAEHGPFTPDELAALARGLADSLRAIHATGIVHRDLKPSNVMLSSDGPVIIDFGIAQIADDVRLTHAGMVTGTPGYLDPEILDGASPTPRCDWWAWAAVLVFAGTGRDPFGRGPGAAVLSRIQLGDADTSGLESSTSAALLAALRPDGHRAEPERVLAVLEGKGNTEILAPVVRPEREADPAEAWASAGEMTQAQDGATRAFGWQLFDDVPEVPGSHSAADTSGQETVGAPQGAPGPQQWTPAAGVREDAPAWAVPPRAHRVTVAVVGALLIGVAALWPGWGLLAWAALIVMAASLGYGEEWLRRMRWKRGRRSGDAALAVLASPWHILRGTLLGLYMLAAGLISGYVAVQVLRLVVPPPPPGAMTGEYLSFGMAVAVLVGWLIPGTRPAHRGARATVEALFPYPALRAVFVILCGVLAGGAFLALLAGLVPAPDWAPLPEPWWLS